MHVFAKVGPKGQVVIPQEFRKKHRISPGDEVLFEDAEEDLRIRAVRPQDLIALLEKTAKEIRAGPINAHDAYEDQMEHRDRKRKRIYGV